MFHFFQISSSSGVSPASFPRSRNTATESEEVVFSIFPPDPVVFLETSILSAGNMDTGVTICGSPTLTCIKSCESVFSTASGRNMTSKAHLSSSHTFTADSSNLVNVMSCHPLSCMVGPFSTAYGNTMRSNENVAESLTGTWISSAFTNRISCHHSSQTNGPCSDLNNICST